MKGKIICIEGNDRTGKHTQAMLLTKYLEQYGYNCKCISFPNYGAPQATPVESYLAGDFPMLGPIEASMLYAFDRVITLKEMKIKEFLKDGGVVIFDRYVPSNIIYQVARSFKKDEKIDVLTNKAFTLSYKIEELEYNILDLPRPDAIVYLHLDRAHNQQLAEKANDNNEIKGIKNDFHERDRALLDRVTEVGIQLARRCSWKIIECLDDDGYICSREDIAMMILRILAEDLNIPNI